MGGALAQAIGAMTGLPTTTFNAPGIGRLLPNLFDELAPVIPDGATPVPNIFNIRLYGDQVSGVDFHVGEITTYDSPFAFEDVINVFALALALQSHKLETLISKIEAGSSIEQGLSSSPQFSGLVYLV